MNRSRDQEVLYQAAYGKYQTGAYKVAAELFAHLVLLDPYQERFWKGLASSHQMNKEYNEALRAWSIHALLAGLDPQTHFHAAECYLSIDELDEAKKALELAKGADKFQEKIAQLEEVLDAKTC